MSIFTLLAWILPIVGVVGVGGLVVIYLAFPLAWAALTPIISRIVEKILSCKPCLYALAGAALCLTSFWYGHHVAASADRTNELAAKVAAQNFDLEEAKNSVADAGRRVKNIEDKASDKQAKDADYIAKLQANPACAITDGDIGDGWMRNHRPHLRSPHAAPHAK
jgi:hypothetical protein